MSPNVKAIPSLHAVVKLAVICAVAFAALGLAGTSNASAACINGVYGYAPNTYNHCVKTIQGLLDDIQVLGATYVYRVTADGYFGSKTQGDVIDFQKAQALTADGVVGSKTWYVLCDTYSVLSSFNPGGPSPYWFDYAGCPLEPGLSH